MNSLKSTVIPQMESAKRKAEKLHKLGRLKNIDLFLFCSRANKMIEFLNEMEEVEVNYGEAGSDQAS